MSCDEKNRNENVYVESLANLPMDVKAERIADSFVKVSNEYEALKDEDVDINKATNTKPSPYITAYKIHKKIKKMKTKTSTILGDIPWKIIKSNSFYLSVPLENIYNRAITHGEYPNIWKLEVVTPVPKIPPPRF